MNYIEGLLLSQIYLLIHLSSFLLTVQLALPPVPLHCISCFLLIYLEQGLVACSIEVLELLVYLGRAEAALVIDDSSNVVVFVICLWEIYRIDVTTDW